MGEFAGKFINDRVNVAGEISDAKANRGEMGGLSFGDLFYAVELQAKILPRTENAAYSKFTFWYSERSTLERQHWRSGVGRIPQTRVGVFSSDSRVIGIARWGRSYNDSALFDH